MLSREKSFTRQVQHLTEKLSSVLTMTSTETRTLPASVPGPPSLLSTQPNNTLAPPDTPTQPAANSQLCPSQLPSTQPEEQDPQVVLLADSNGKFLDTRKLFLIKRQAMKLLKKETLRSPQYLVIHTGTNDPHTLRRDTAEAVRKMAEQASKEFPEFRHPHCGQRYAATAAPCLPPHLQQRSYAAVVAQPAATHPPPASSELGDIRMILHPPSPCYL
ncbi:hypothetical protein NQZ68_013361 [Dissostichus eleginoides]|nr:hypothetical protein NQZ68_013361 [Dissostichus eleginoides]